MRLPSQQLKARVRIARRISFQFLGYRDRFSGRIGICPLKHETPCISRALSCEDSVTYASMEPHSLSAFLKWSLVTGGAWIVRRTQSPYSCSTYSCTPGCRNLTLFFAICCSICNLKLAITHQAQDWPLHQCSRGNSNLSGACTLSYGKVPPFGTLVFPS